MVEGAERQESLAFIRESKPVSTFLTML